MDSRHFRQKAARAREMAQSGDDIRLSRMLLEVALDLDVEAEAMEAQETPGGHRSAPRYLSENYGALLHRACVHQDNADTTPVEIINLSVGGVKFRISHALTPGSQMILELPSHALRLDGTIMSVCARETAMVFDLGSRTDPGLTRLLQPEWVEA